jgi:hypothetical protein
MPMATSRTPRRASSGFTCVCVRARERERECMCAHPCVCVREIRIETQRQSERETGCVGGGCYAPPVRGSAPAPDRRISQKSA